MTIYIDIIFLENLFMNYIILFASGIIVKAPTKILRFSLASGLGSIYAIASYTSKMEMYSSLILRITLSVLMTYIAFNPKRVKELFKQLVIFYLTSFTFGGVAFFLLYFVRPQDVIFQNRGTNRHISYENNIVSGE